MTLGWLFFALTSMAFAALEEPIELMTLTRVEPTNFQAGLCPGNPAVINPESFRNRVLVGQPSINEILAADRRQFLAMDAADAIYTLPDLESVNSGAELVTKTVPFLRSLPAGYEFYSYFSEPESGMKYMLLKPIDDAPNEPYVLAIAGTQSFLDWMVDIDLGRAQMIKLSRLLRLFTTCQFLDSYGQPLASHGLIVTGHSLGGGLAQAVAYEIQRQRLEGGMSPMSIELITFNGFGARTLIEKDATFDTTTEALLKARNYFVDGDIVSRIGYHIGATFELLSTSIASPNLLDAVACHMMSTIREICPAPVALLPSTFMISERKSPRESRALQNLVQVGHIVRFLPNWIYNHREARIVQMLEEAVLTIERVSTSDPLNREAARYVSRLIFAREISLRDADRSPEHVRALRQLRLRLNEL